MKKPILLFFVVLPLICPSGAMGDSTLLGEGHPNVYSRGTYKDRVSCYREDLVNDRVHVEKIEGLRSLCDVVHFDAQTNNVGLRDSINDHNSRIIMLEKEVVLDNEDASRDSSANTNYNWVSKTEWQATMKNNDDRFSKLEKDMSEIKQILLDIKENRMHAEEL